MTYDQKKRMFIIKTGTTYPALMERLGDFDRWTAEAMGGIEADVVVVDAENGAVLPLIEDCAGVVITGSPAMVTDQMPWSVQLEKWLKVLLRARVPVFGICYGHQLLAQAAGVKITEGNARRILKVRKRRR